MWQALLIALAIAVHPALAQNSTNGTFLTRLYNDILGDSYQQHVGPFRNGRDYVDVTLESDPYALLAVVGLGTCYDSNNTPCKHL